MGLCPCFSVVWLGLKPSSLSFLQNTDKVAKGWEALPVRVWEEGSA